MEVTLLAKAKYIDEKVETDHYWYDQVNKRMLHGRGGRMEFKYDAVEKRAYPVLVDDYQRVYSNDFDGISDWVKRNASSFNAVVINKNRGHSITLELSATRMGDMLDSLNANRITCDYDESEWKQEMRDLAWLS